jgi:endonuclease YncB( thermonuclease family)
MKHYSTIFILLALIILPTLAAGFLDEVQGRIFLIVDGETFNVVVSHGDNRVPLGDTIRIRLADIDCTKIHSQYLENAASGA